MVFLKKWLGFSGNFPDNFSDKLFFSDNFNEIQIKKIAFQLLEAAASFAELRLQHNTLNPRNVLLDMKLNVFVVGFRNAEITGVPSMWNRKGEAIHYHNLEFSAPETLFPLDVPQEYLDRSDVWSTGVIIAELFLKRRLLKPEMRDLPRQLKCIIQNLGLEVNDTELATCISFETLQTFLRRCHEKIILKNDFASELRKNGASEIAVDLLKKMLQFDCTKRISARDALQHAWFGVESNSSRSALPSETKRIDEGIWNSVRNVQRGKLEELVEALSPGLVAAAVSNAASSGSM